VYAATHTLTRRRVALKVLRESHNERPELRARFIREARVACAVKHPSLLEIDDVFELPDSTPVLVMDLLEGESLDSKLRREGRIELGELAGLVSQVAAGVAAAHALGIVHRDLKPENIFLVRSPGGRFTVRVLDFGIAKLTASEGDAGRTAETRRGTILGTPRYMAPEQVFGREDVDRRVDVWALGAILYEGLAGVHPIEADTVPEALMRIVHGDIPPLDLRVQGLPSEVIDLVRRMLQVDPGGRPSDLREVIAVLERHALGSSVTLAEIGSPQGGSAGSMPPAPLWLSTRPRPPRWENRVLSVGLLGGTVLTAMAVALLVAQQSRTPAARPEESLRPQAGVGPAVVSAQATLVEPQRDDSKSVPEKAASETSLPGETASVQPDARGHRVQLAPTKASFGRDSAAVAVPERAAEPRPGGGTLAGLTALNNPTSDLTRDDAGAPGPSRAPFSASAGVSTNAPHPPVALDPNDPWATAGGGPR